MKNLEMLEKAFGVEFDRSRSDFGLGPVPSESEVLVRRLLYTGGLKRVRYPFSLNDHLSPNARSLFDLAMLMVLYGDTTHLVEVCEADQRIEKIRLRKERLLSRLYDEMEWKNSQTRKGEAWEVVRRHLKKVYNETLMALYSAIHKEERLFLDRNLFGWGIDRSTEIAGAWEEYSQKEKAFRDLKFLKARNIRNLK